MKKRILFVALVFALLLPTTPMDADCRLCWVTDRQVGECQIILRLTDPTVRTLNNCQGIQRCFNFLGGSFCYADCTGDVCYLV